MGDAFWANFLGHSPKWFKLTIIGCLLVNPIVMVSLGKFAAGWLLLAEFIFCLAMALKCYPLLPGGLLAIQAVVLGMTTPKHVYHEVEQNFPVLLLLMFMVAGIYHMKDLLQWAFTKVLLGVKSKTVLSLIFCIMGAFLSAFLDALTVTAVMITVAYGFYQTYHKWDSAHNENVEAERQVLEQWRGVLCSLLMHGAVGTMLGGVCTLVGEPQNLLIGNKMGWHFGEFFFRMLPVTMPVLATGLLTCVATERWKIMGHGVTMPDMVRRVLEQEDNKPVSNKLKAMMAWQALGGVFIIIALALHIAEVGLIGLTVIVVLAACTGITSEHQIGESFKESMPFCALLVVFFVIVAVIAENKLFDPVTHWVLALEGKSQLLAFYGANGLLSAISDNVFVATVYMNETKTAFDAGQISREQFELIAVAINTGTNVPSIATPNGQAAFLFLLTSGLAGVIQLSYGRMLKLAFPYTITCTIAGILGVALFLG
jgi:NhaB family Na+:H+ antiporter